MSVKSQESNMRRLSMLLSHDLSYGGFYIPFVLKEYIVQQETP